MSAHQEQCPVQETLWSIYQELKAGRISRREFLSRSTRHGVQFPIALFVLNSVKVGDVAAAPRAQGAAATRPSEGTAHQQRGAGGELRILQWQAASHLSPHVSTGDKDSLAASLVTEPLLSYAPDGSLLPTLVAEVPSTENGGLSPDLRTVTYNLLPGVLWSDGNPFTADDVVFTWQWIMDPANQAVGSGIYQPIVSVEAVDPLTVKVTFAEPTLGWYVPFTGTYVGAIYPKHVWDGKDPVAANDAFRRAPIGTGPYVIESFTENDQATYIANENYREANKPFFARINLKGGGDAASAAQAVLQTGEWDFAWNVLVEPSILREMEKAGKGKVLTSPPTNIEGVMINFSDPNLEVDGQRSQKDTLHPFFSDMAVRQALSLACDRQSMSDQFYLGGEQEPPGRNILTGIPAFESPNTSWEFDLNKANLVLDEAGWVMEGGVRRKGDVTLKVKYAAAINAVRQKEQAVNKKNWEAIGFQVTLVQVDAGVFFDSAAGNEQNANHFYYDLEMYVYGPTSPFPLLYLQVWYAGPDSSNIAQRANGWSGQNTQRYVNPAYDALYESLLTETDAEKAAEAIIRMNDILVDDVAEIPLVARAKEKYAIINTLREENIAANFAETLYWNIANWNRAG